MNVLEEITNKLNKINNKIYKIIFIFVTLSLIASIFAYLAGNAPLIGILFLITLIILVGIAPFTHGSFFWWKK